MADAPRPVRINAQSHLVDWYARFGFEVAGSEFIEDGIPHTPMAVAT
jgi:ElaA protein